MQPSASDHPDSDFDSVNLATSFQTLALSPDWNQISACSIQPHHNLKPDQSHHHLYPHTSYQPPLPTQPPLPDPYPYQAGEEPSSHLPTEAELSRRARAAAGLNVSAPEFVPSFAAQPLTNLSQSQHPSEHVSFYHPPYMTQYPSSQLIDPPHASYQQPSNFDVYTNVTDLQAIDLPLPSRRDPVSHEEAVDSFDRQFPALPSAAPTPSKTQPRTTGAQALGWEALQRSEKQKVHAEAKQNEFEALQSAVDQLVADEEEHLEAEVTNDVGDVWVTTGTSVAQLYQELRAEASVQASIRNKFFDRAAAAFKRGDGATAKKLSAQGREANERMKELHRGAADAIFGSRNPPSTPDVIDLHGLHVSEAVERLPEALERAPEGKVRILTGTGHHTKGTGRARLRPAVKKWLQENAYFFSEVADANDFVGSFVVDVKR